MASLDHASELLQDSADDAGFSRTVQKVQKWALEPAAAVVQVQDAHWLPPKAASKTGEAPTGAGAGGVGGWFPSPNPSELPQPSEESPEAADAEATLMARLNRLQEAMDGHAKDLSGPKSDESSGSEDLDETKAEAETNRRPRRRRTDDGDEPSSPSTLGDGNADADSSASAAAEAAAAATAAAAAAAAAAARRRRLDHTWEAEAERDFEARCGEDSIPPDAGRGEAIAAELKSNAQLLPLPGPPLPSPGEPSFKSCGHPARSAPDGLQELSTKSSLRRLKQLEPEVVCSVEKECGVQVSRGAEVFRLILENPSSSLKPSTRVLLLTAGEAFLCEEPISEECGPESGAIPSESSSLDAIPGGQPASTSIPTADSSEGSGSGSWIEAELRYFRAAPKRGGALAQRLGRVPTLHVTLLTDDGMHQAMEFIGVHQRRYYVEDPPSDAIARNLEESLLRVALEFVFHPSRTKYTKDKLILRECSIDAEARHSRELLLPRMIEKVRESNGKIREICLELCDELSGPSLRCQAAGSLGSRKDKSFLVLDEDVLKVAPAKEQMARAPSDKGAFKGLGAGFLNTSKARREGLFSASKPTAAEGSNEAVVSGSSSSSSSCQGAPAAKSVSQTIPVGERTRMNPEPAEGMHQRGIQTDAAEKRRLLLSAAEPPPGEAGTRAVAASLAARASPPEEPELSDDEGVEGIGLSELANQLFGGALSDEDDEGLTESTGLGPPSPLGAGSSRDGGALSERSESAAELAPASGLRLLQQRRRSGSGANGAAGEGESPERAAGQSAADEGADLVALWMKQRW